jgi:hypothetical protein
MKTLLISLFLASSAVACDVPAAQPWPMTKPVVRTYYYVAPVACAPATTQVPGVIPPLPDPGVVYQAPLVAVQAGDTSVVVGRGFHPFVRLRTWFQNR